MSSGNTGPEDDMENTMVVAVIVVGLGGIVAMLWSGMNKIDV